MRRLMMFSCAVFLSFAWTIPAVHGEGSEDQKGPYAFTRFDALFPGALSTDVLGINNAGQVVGDSWSGDFDNAQGYLRGPGGDFTEIEVPPSLSGGPSAFQWPIGLNNDGVIVGRYRDAGVPNRHGDHCYVLKEGVFIPIDVPTDLGGFGPTFSTRCRGINESGQITGFFFDPAFHRHGFLLSGGVFTTFDFPGAVNTLTRKINNSGQIVGSYLLADGLVHGFLLARGNITSIDVPGARETDATDINNAGEIVGAYRDTNNHVHAFRLAGGVFTTVRLPGVTQNANGPVLFDLNDYVSIFGINDWGAIAGTYLGRDGNFHGFMGVPRHEGGDEGGDQGGGEGGD